MAVEPHTGIVRLFDFELYYELFNDKINPTWISMHRSKKET